MAYKLFDKAGNRINFHDLQDKGPWCKHGASKEEVFVDKYGEKLNIIVNPEKVTNPYAPDLSYSSPSKLADLKTQNTPFFQAKSRFGLDPQYAVVFNHKDRIRYQKNHPDIDIYFWVEWLALKFEHLNGNVEVTPMEGVWKISFGELDKVLKNAPLHYYGQRRNDTKGNAKASYVIDLNSTSFKKII